MKCLGVLRWAKGQLFFYPLRQAWLDPETCGGCSTYLMVGFDGKQHGGRDRESMELGEKTILSEQQFL